MRIAVLCVALLLAVAPVMGMVIPSEAQAGTAAMAVGPALSGGYEYEYEDDSSKVCFITIGLIFVCALILTM